VVCRKVLTKGEADLFKNRIDDDYRVFMYAETCCARGDGVLPLASD